MEKAFLFVLTVSLGMISAGLSKLNASDPAEGGKIIKAALISSDAANHCDTDSLYSRQPGRAKKSGFKVKTIVIDPGHGGHDPGCLGSNSREKHNCLAIGKYFAEALKMNYPDLNVIMTRSTDVFIPLNERAAIATRNQADLFVSIHCNFIPNASHVQGAETYVLGLHATKENLEVARRENAAILYEDNYQETYGYDPNSPEAYIMLSMFQNAYLEQSILFAQKVQQNMATEANRRNRGVKQAGFLVLRHATMPSVLVETGYLSNRNEEDFIRTKKGQKAIANSLLLAFSEYKAEAENDAQSLAVRKLNVDRDEDFKAEFVTVQVAASANPGAKPNPTSSQETPLQAGSNAGHGASTSSMVAAAGSLEPPPGSLVVQPAKEGFAGSPLPKKTAPVPQPQKESAAIAPPSQPYEIPPPGSKILPATPISTTPAPAKSQSAEIQYRVQLAASPNPLNVSQGKWSNVDYLIEVIEENRLFKYQVRNFATLEDANLAKQKLRSLGFGDAFVVAYQNGQRVNPR